MTFRYIFQLDVVKKDWHSRTGCVCWISLQSPQTCVIPVYVEFSASRNGLALDVKFRYFQILALLFLLTESRSHSIYIYKAYCPN